MRLLSLFTGYGGLDTAVQKLTGAELIGVSDIDPGPCKVLAHYHPNIPNIGDIKKIDWHSTDVPEFDILTGGYPCQPFSLAGHRRGTDDPRHLWPNVLEAIQAHRPARVYLENVRGHLTKGFDVVLADLAAAGYEVSWSIFAASSVGAAHRRERLYIYATPAERTYTVELPAKLPSAGRIGLDGFTELPRADAGVRPEHKLFPTPQASDTTGARKTRNNGFNACKDMPLLLAKAGAAPFNDGARLFPTPNTMDTLPVREGEAIERQLRRGGGVDAPRRTTMGNLREDIMLTLDQTRYGGAPREVSEWSPFNVSVWGAYAEAVARWALITGNQPPAPVQLNRNGNPQLTADFPAWLMGLPNGYLTNPDIGLTRSEAIKLAGNGVVPQAAYAAYGRLTGLAPEGGEQSTPSS